jgi:hypothetical protein
MIQGGYKIKRSAWIRLLFGIEQNDVNATEGVIESVFLERKHVAEPFKDSDRIAGGCNPVPFVSSRSEMI